MYDLNEILIRSVECKASDIHLSVGRAPNYRIDGVLHTGGEEKLMPDDVRNLIDKTCHFVNQCRTDHLND